MRVALGDDLGEHRERDLLLGAADRAIRSATDALQVACRAVCEHVENRGGPASAGHQADIRDLVRQERLDGFLVVMPHGRDHGKGRRTRVRGREVERADDMRRLWKIRRGRAWVHRARFVADGRAQPDQRVRRGRIANDEEQRPRQVRVDEDVQRAGAGAGAHVRDDARLMLGRHLRCDLDQSRLPVAQRM